MEFRATQDAAAVELTLDEFCALVRRGGVRPEALYREPWTHGEWRTVDNLPLFHRNSPTPFPRGPKLVEADEARRASEEMMRRVRQFDHAAAIERLYRLRPLAQIAATGGTLGAARLTVLPSFDPDIVVTVAFRAAALTVEAATGATQVWRSEIYGEPFDVNAVRHAAGEVRYRQAPDLFANWGTFVDRVLRLESVNRPCLDGVGYGHAVAGDDGEVVAVAWGNPDERENLGQVDAIDAYRRLLRAAGLKRFASGMR